MGLVHQGIPGPLVSLLREKFSISILIETGTYLGETAYWASQQFEKVVTIERSPALWREASEKYAHIKNIQFVHGESSAKFKEILPCIKSTSMFWLDAHWSGSNTSGEDDECPLIRELREINRQSLDHFVLIDDARLFLSTPPYPHSPTQWPDLVSVIGTLEPIEKGRFIVIIDDVIVAVPLYAKPVLVKYCQERNTEEQEKRTVCKESLFSSFKCLLRGKR